MNYLCPRKRLCRILPLALLGFAIVGCDAVKGLFQPGLTIVVENGTSFTAAPDIRMSDSRNILEDAFANPQSVSDATTIGTVAPNQTSSIRLDCKGDLELISFNGVKFRDAGGFPFGDAGENKSWRRDVDFDCGDTIRIRLSGTVFFFNASTSVERTSGAGGTPGAPVIVDGNDNEDIGQLIDQILGS